jgi:pyruvate dehydrogenase E1 component beta subunit
VLIVDEGWKSGSLSGEIPTRIIEHCFFDLDAPVERLCRREVPIPYARHLELVAIPQTEDIVKKIQEMLK